MHLATITYSGIKRTGQYIQYLIVRNLWPTNIGHSYNEGRYYPRRDFKVRPDQIDCMFNILPPPHDISNLVSSTTVTWYQISYKNHVITFKHVIKSNHVVRIITWFTLKSRDCYEFINKFVLLPPFPPLKKFSPM